MRPWHSQSLVLMLSSLAFLSGCGRHHPVPPPDPPPAAAQPSAAVESDSAPRGVHHVVAAGQTLWRIARAYGLRVDDLAAANGIDDPTRIEAGRRLWIPGASEVLEVPPAGTAPGGGGPRSFIWPVRGSISSGFGTRNGRRHAGIDIRAPSGAPVRASRDGLVAYSGSRFRGYGNLVILDHGDGFRTYYAHNSANLVEEGQRVRQGDRIARVGNTGNASGPHLHFEIRRGNVLLDPREHLP